jgi:hypothetical protein
MDQKRIIGKNVGQEEEERHKGLQTQKKFSARIVEWFFLFKKINFIIFQHGSRFIQQKLERASPQEKQQVFQVPEAPRVKH